MPWALCSCGSVVRAGSICRCGNYIDDVVQEGSPALDRFAEAISTLLQEQDETCPNCQQPVEQIDSTDS